MSVDWRRQLPHLAAGIEYAEAIASRRAAACLQVRQACERQLNDLERTDFPYYFDGQAAENVCAYLETLPHIEGQWAARGELLHLEPWQCFPLTTVFGWKHKEQGEDGAMVRKGMRRFRTSYEEVPRKNGKTLIAAGIGLYMLDADGEAGAQVYSVATTRDQARHVFDAARQMARRATALDVRAHNIYNLDTASNFEPLHAQGETLDGYNIHCALNDELHAWHKRSVYDVIETAMGARSQPLMFDITTAGDNLEGICYDLHGYGERILNGTIKDESFFSIIYTLDKEDIPHWQEPEIWRKANPNYGISVSPLDVKTLALKARELPSQQNAFMTKRLNVWVNSSSAWMNMMAWTRGFDPKLKINDFNGLPCFLGVDLASKIDVNSLAIVFKRQENGAEHYYCFMRHWLPEEAVHSDRFGIYDGWVRSGHLRTTPGNVVDIDAIENETDAIAKAHSVIELGVDPGHNSTQYGVHMMERGVRVVDVRPLVMNFSEPMKWLEAWVKDGRFHFNCPVLTWMISNVVAKADSKDNIYPRKESASRKIDGAIALLIAINRLKSAPPERNQMFFLG